MMGSAGFSEEFKREAVAHLCNTHGVSSTSSSSIAQKRALLFTQDQNDLFFCKPALSPCPSPPRRTHLSSIRASGVQVNLSISQTKIY